MGTNCCSQPDPVLDETWSEDPETIYGYGICETCGQTIEAVYKLEETKTKE